MLVRLGVFAIKLLLKASHCLDVVVADVIGVVEDGHYPHNTLVYNLLFLEGDTSGHVVDRCYSLERQVT